MEPNTLLPTPKPPKNIRCPSCPRRFSSRKALENHSRALHTSLSPSQTEAIAASVSQAKANNRPRASKIPSPPIANKPSPPNNHPENRPGHSPPTSTPPLSASPPNDTPDPTTALTSRLLTLSLSSPPPNPKPPPEPPSTDLDALIRESHQSLGYGCLILTTDMDDGNEEYFLSFELPPPPATRLGCSPTKFKKGIPEAKSQPHTHITRPLPRALRAQAQAPAPPSNTHPPIGNFIPSASSISAERSEIVFPERNPRGGARRGEPVGESGWATGRR